MYRGIHHSTALTLHHQSLTILSEGTRISRKCSRLKNFLSCFGTFAIDFVKRHHSLNHYLTLRHRFKRAIARAAAHHFRVWRLTLYLLWPRFVDYILRRVLCEGYHPSIIQLMRRIFQRSVRRYPIHTKVRIDSDDESPNKKRKHNPDRCQLKELPTGPSHSLPANLTMSHSDDQEIINDEDSKMFELPSDDSATAR